MKHRIRTVQPLPSYTRRKPLAGGKWGYYFEPPGWAVVPPAGDDRGPCPVGAEALGTDYDAAVQRVERVLLPLFHNWRTRGDIDLAPAAVTEGTLDWLFAAYRQSDKFGALDRKTKALHERGFALVGNYALKDGRRLGTVRLTQIDTTVVDPLYAKLLVTGGKRAGGPRRAGEEPLPGAAEHRERRTTINHAMKSCRRAWNVVRRKRSDLVPATNPFAKMELREVRRPTPTASYEDLQAAVAQADATGLPSLATALMVTWEWLQREEHIFTAFRLDHYRPKDHPDEVLIVHPKTGEEVWVPLFDEAGASLFPELMMRMDALKRDRIGQGPFFVRDWCDRSRRTPLPWATPKGGLDLVRKKSKAVLLGAELADDLSFTSFRHGGLTELGDADLTDTQIRALSRQTKAVLPRYVKKTQRQIIAGTRKRRALRPVAAEHDQEPGQLSFDQLMGGK
ncbi:hypothetical protein [Rhodoplanes roseus]|uniref:Tyr recombinase domain-containing protein n=1 Tax=Rhodoplanes roseus TaxID=29409 RepID=A0A327KY20_9BRAD|nr:hypothetical protein [Rhodoplanes roseus]RAI43161.1 hypothetical protein CH341_15815 [Rhodoplanes roseus]